MTGLDLALGENEAAAQELTPRLVAYNRAHAPALPSPAEAPRPLHVFARTDTNKVVGVW